MFSFNSGDFVDFQCLSSNLVTPGCLPVNSLFHFGRTLHDWVWQGTHLLSWVKGLLRLGERKDVLSWACALGTNFRGICPVIWQKWQHISGPYAKCWMIDPFLNEDFLGNYRLRTQMGFYKKALVIQSSYIIKR